MISIYTLIDPRDELIRYVGQTSNPKVRYRSHLRGNKYRNTHTTNWIQGLLDLNLKPIMIEIDQCEIKDLDITEQSYIRLYKSFGCNLTNHSIGGHSSLGCKHSLESRLKRSLRQKGKSNGFSAEGMKSKKLKHSEYLKLNPKQRIDNKMSKEDRYKAALKGNKIASEKLSKIVYKIENGKILETYKSATEGAKINNIPVSSFNQFCTGRRKQNFIDFYFIYKIDYKTKNNN